MFGLDFAPHEAINALAGGVVGGVVSLWGAWVLAKRQLRNTRTLAHFLDAALDSDHVEMYEEDGELKRKVYLTATIEGTSRDTGSLTEARDERGVEE